MGEFVGKLPKGIPAMERQLSAQAPADGDGCTADVKHYTDEEYAAMVEIAK